MLEKGMYVRCPFDLENEYDPRVFWLGQIVEVSEDRHEALVEFHDLMNARKYYDFVPDEKWINLDQLSHCKILDNSEVIVRGPNYEGKVLSYSGRKEDQFHYYFVQHLKNGQSLIKEISEYYLQASFNRVNYSPVMQMKKYEFHNPFWYVHRDIVTNSLYSLRNATYGFEILVGSRVFLLPHQVDTIIRVISEPHCRFMLADEVGMGKTIEACVIMKGLNKKLGKLRTLIIAPDSLVHQWCNEFSYKFWLDVPIWDGRLRQEDCDLIIPLERLNTKEGQEVLSLHWDLCIVDETHRLLSMEAEYQLVYNLSKELQNILLLTATPIQQMQIEYHQLLALLAPGRYGNMAPAKFEQLLARQAFLRGRVHRLVRDIDDYIEDELAEDYLDELGKIAEKLEDKIFNELVREIDIDAEDMGLDAVKLALAYIGEHYQIERHIIRHRRAELRESMPDQPMPDRQLELIKYTPSGADYGFYELNTYELLLTYLAELSDNSDLPQVGDYIKIFLGAMFSSPWALHSLILMRRSVLANKSYTMGISNVPNTPRHISVWRQQVLGVIQGFAGEESLLELMLQTCELWFRAVEAEFMRVDELLDDPDQIRGRLFKVLDYLSESLEYEKFIIFTAWKETLEPLARFLEKQFGDLAVATFYGELNEEKLQKAVDRFQSDPKCRFLLCDELGGESRNFQMADAIIHVDLPWSPLQLEQRIGRLDRIGRDKDVLSVVVCSGATIEEGLFNLWHEGLNIFQELPSGLEIALSDIHDQILLALKTNLQSGLDTVLEDIKKQLHNMRKMVDQERYYDMARQLDRKMIDQLTMLIEKFDKNEGQSLYNTMMSWTSSTGLVAEKDRQGQIVTFSPDRLSFKSMQNTLFIPPDMEKLWERSRSNGHIQEIHGTFSRTLAVAREDLVFYAPSDPFFDSIVNNADECARGRCCAMAIQSDLPFDWQGFVLTWSPVLNPRPLLALEMGTQYLALAQGYMPLEQIVTLEGMSEQDRDKDETILRQTIQRALKQVKDSRLIAHLGQRTSKSDFLKIREKYRMSNINWFKRQFPPDVWGKIVQEAYDSSLQKVKGELVQSLELKRAMSDFQRRYNGIKASALYYGDKDEVQKLLEIKAVYQVLWEGLKRPIRRLESIAFVLVVGKIE
ncbi:RNA polymerase associated protein RapA [Desulfocucumis palustris]|uniref:RNA polymerase associated protein RapA n=1 Tax=Desulfocucumis palustris TaxID=1898651 RepID=A0A2L2X6T0_9FIRM|nr:SNF2-related protein [Desulfocucumis palustris]GBF31839.1 RNA polymerase associated protein RapA [Desulfocucumis palustris]